MANDELVIDGNAIAAAVASLTSGKTKSKARLSARKTTAKPSTTKKSTAKKPAAKKPAKKPAKTKTKAADESPAKRKKSATSKKPTSKKTTTTSPTTRSRGLEADLKKNADESYTRMELLDGIRLAVQSAGSEAITQTLLAMVTDWAPGLGEQIEKQTVSLLLKKTKSTYSKSSADQKKSLRALIHWIRNDFDLGKSLAASEFTSGFVGSETHGSHSAALNLKPLNHG